MDIGFVVPNLMSSKTFLQPAVEVYTVAAKLQELGHKVHVFDFRTTNSSFNDAVLSIPSKISLCFITTSPYDMTQMYHSDYRLKYALSFIHYLKELRPELTIAVYGAHSTLKPEQILDDTLADVVIRWEIEGVAPMLCHALSNGKSFDDIPNLVLRKGNQYEFTAVNNVLAHPLLPEDYPIPAWELVDFSKYFGYELDEVYKRLDQWGVILGSRGCPYSCSFCFNFFGNQVRYRSVNSIANEFIKLESYRLKRIFFLDMTFTLRRDWVLSLCAELQKRGTTTPWICQTRCDLVDDELLSAMKKAGCISIQFGVESTDEEVLKGINKQVTQEQILAAVDGCRKVQIIPGAFLMVGTPYESQESYQHTVDFLKEKSIPFIPIVYTPRLGSKLGDEIARAKNVNSWDEMLALRGRLSENYNIKDMIKGHAKLRGQSFGTSPTNFNQPVLRNAIQHHQIQFQDVIPLPDGKHLQDCVVHPKEKEEQGFLPFISFPITTACPFKCIYCGTGGENTISPTQNIPLTTLIDLSITAKNLGIRKVRLTGGEPLTHPDFGDILRFLAEQDFYLLVNTNGALIERKIDQLLRPTKNIHFAVSLDTLDEDRFNKISNSKGFHTPVLNGIQILKDLGLLMRINMVVGEFNVDEVFPMIDFCRDLGCDLKLQEVASVPYPHLDWTKTHIDLDGLEKELDCKADKIFIHKYASAYGWTLDKI